MISISSTSPTRPKEKTPIACWLKEKIEARSNFYRKVYYDGSLLSMF
jgi:hypothetical protein